VPDRASDLEVIISGGCGAQTGIRHVKSSDGGFFGPKRMSLITWHRAWVGAWANVT